MENLKKWITIDTLKYELEDNSKSIGTLEIIYKNFERKAIFTIQNEVFTLKYNGFWKSNFEITDTNGKIIMKSYTEKWFSSTTILEYNGKKLELKIRNNPLAEYVIFDKDKEILAYGLDTSNKTVQVKIHSDTTDYLLDYLLWYIFVPIAQENMGDSFLFQSLVINQ